MIIPANVGLNVVCVTYFQLANQLNLTSAGVLDNATSINSAAQELASNVSLTTDKVEELEQTVAEDKRTIAMTTETARESISVANDIKQEIVIIRVSRWSNLLAIESKRCVCVCVCVCVCECDSGEEKKRGGRGRERDISKSK